jgi:hypothetical protein
MMSQFLYAWSQAWSVQASVSRSFRRLGPQPPLRISWRICLEFIPSYWLDPVWLSLGALLSVGWDTVGFLPLSEDRS